MRASFPVAFQIAILQREHVSPVGAEDEMEQAIRGVLLSKDPIIIFVFVFEADENLAVLAKELHDREVTFIVPQAWSCDREDDAALIVSNLKARSHVSPLHRFVMFTNSHQETENFTRLGVRSFLGNTNSFVDPALFLPNPTEPKLFDAVYNAALERWKRHELCRDIGSVSFIYYSHSQGDLVGPVESLKAIVPGARFMNEERASTPHGGLTSTAVRQILNQSRVGLCLSDEEGAMYASIEYLLCGLPIVSTPSIGGRDFFFHPDYVEMVDPTPETVASAIPRVLARAPPAHEIRSRTIALQQKQISLFIEFLDRLARAEGGNGFTREQWNDCYCHKLTRSESLRSLLSRLPSTAASTPGLKARLRRARKKTSHLACKWFGAPGL